MIEEVLKKIRKKQELNDDAEGDSELEEIVKGFEKEHFSMEDFRKAMDVEVINHSHDNGVDFEKTNEAIKHLKRTAIKVKDKEILDNLHANFDELEEGVLPELRSERDETLAMQEKTKKEMAGLSDIQMLGRMTPEHIQYLRERESELTSKFRKQLTRGVATTATGAAVSGFKLGTEIGVAGIATGATASGKNGNMLEDIVTIVPNAVKATESTLHTAGSLPSRIGKAATDKVIGDAKDTPLNIIDDSMKINDKYYRNKAALDKLDRNISDAESERRRLLNKIHEKLKDEES